MRASNFTWRYTIRPGGGARHLIRPWRTIAAVEGGSVVATSRLLVCALSCAALVAVSACGSSPANKSGAAQEPKARVLTLATALSDDGELIPFVDAVARLSRGTLRIERRKGMHAGVRSAGSVDPLLHSVTEAGQRGLQNPLDRPASRIDLEAIEVRSVIFDRGAKAHGGGLSDA